MPTKIVQTALPFTVFGLEADRDYLLARFISFVGGGFHSRAGFMCQQACEKYMKAVLVQAQGRYPVTHKLLEIAELCTEVNDYFGSDSTRRVLKNFDYFEQVGRYGAAANFDPMAVTKAELQTAGVMIWREEFRDDLDAFVFKTRGILDWKAAGFDDQLQSIVGRNHRSMLVATWIGRPPLRVVLTKQNRYFKG